MYENRIGKEITRYKTYEKRIDKEKGIKNVREENR
jgi:hypothetical protein